MTILIDPDGEDCERKIAFWEARTTQYQKKTIEFGAVMVAFSQPFDL